MSEQQLKLENATLVIPGDYRAVQTATLGAQTLEVIVHRKWLAIELPTDEMFIDRPLRMIDGGQQTVLRQNQAEVTAITETDDFVLVVHASEQILVSSIPKELILQSPYAAAYQAHQSAEATGAQVVRLPRKIDFAIDYQQANAKLDVSNGYNMAVQYEDQPTVAALVFKQRRSTNYSVIQADSVVAGTFNYDLEPVFSDLIDLPKNGRWNVYALFSTANQPFELVRLYLDGDLPANDADRFLKTYDTNEKFDVNNKQLQLYLTTGRGFSLAKNTAGNLLKEKHDMVVTTAGYKHRGTTIQLAVEVATASHLAANDMQIALVQRNPDEFNVREFATQVRYENGTYYLSAQQDLAAWTMFAQYWDVYVKMPDAHGVATYVRVVDASTKVLYQVQAHPIRGQVHLDSDIFYPYITKNGSLSFTYRHREVFETPKNYVKETLAYWYVRLFGKQLRKRHIWVGYEKMAQSAHDSGYHFFNYVYQNKLYDNYYYVIDPQSPEYHFVSDKLDKVLPFMSFKYFVYLFAADTLISSDTRRNAYNLMQRETPMGKAVATKKLVYLQHGVNGIKRVIDFYKSAGNFDLVIAPDEWEKQRIAMAEWGFSDHEVVAAGLPRWDVLTDRTAEVDFKQIFVMPTWRNWMQGMPDELFVQSEFYQEYQAFLTDPRLKQLLVANNVRIAFFMHPKFKDYMHLFTIDADIIDSYEFLEVPMDEMIMKSSLMISDYSSVQWEMFYLKKPTIFYQFDQAKYLEYEGTSMNFETELFGDITFTADETITAIADYIKSDFAEKPEFAAMRSTYFDVVDTDNSKRVYEAIKTHDDLIHSPTTLGIGFRVWLGRFANANLGGLMKLWRKLF